ncbi:MAG: hypothetical protein H6922_01680 [Pseudomonadaceae bacterium]|nr:hypothetical protein [Pseudomonadaceae bacterium]
MLYALGVVVLWVALHVVPVYQLSPATYADYAWAYLGSKSSQRTLAFAYKMAEAQYGSAYKSGADYWTKRADD